MKTDTSIAYVGNWGFAPAPKGISIFRYSAQTGDLVLLDTVRQDIAAGQLCLDQTRNILYASNECGERVGEIGGGGYVYAFRIAPETGELTLISQQDSLSPEPSFLCLTKSRKYLIVCHCADPWHVTKLVRNPDGTIGNEVLFDDTALILFPILPDGSIAKPCDAMITKGTGGKGPRSERSVDPVSGHIQLVEVISRLHAVYNSPDGSIFITLDKGMDRLISFRVDEEKGRFVRLDEYQVEEVASFPRYGAFHPTLPIFYADNENRTLLNCFLYDGDGKLSLIDKIPLTFHRTGLIDGKPAGCQDIVISGDGRMLYISLSGLNEIAAVSLDEKGRPKLVQEISSCGTFPRCLQFTPDGKYLLAGNMISGDITSYEIQEDGQLTFTGKKYRAVSPSAIRFYER